MRETSMGCRRLLRAGLLWSMLSMAWAGCHAAADQIKVGRRALLQEIRFHAFDKVELAQEERCPAWLRLTPHEAGCRRLTVIYRGIYLSGMLVKQSLATNRLSMYHVGHESTLLPSDNASFRGDAPLDVLPVNTVGEDAISLIRQMFDRGDDVLILFMPGIGLTPQAHETEEVLRAHHTVAQHNAFALLDYPADSAAAYFIAHVKGFLDRHGKRYKKVTMVGRSGGGWATTLAAAYETRINCSISFFGTLPLRLRLPLKEDQRNDLGDFEQFGLYLYKRLDYLDLYAQATSNGRRHTQVFNLKDDCCFSGEFKGSKIPGLFAARYPKARGFRVDILPVRSKRDHGNLDEPTWALLDERCPAE